MIIVFMLFSIPFSWCGVADGPVFGNLRKSWNSMFETKLRIFEISGLLPPCIPRIVVGLPIHLEARSTW